jgi:predicted transcriptional regulator
MISSDDVLKAIVKCKRDDNHVDYNDIMRELNMDDVSLIPFLKELSCKRYIIQTLENLEITSLGLSAYNDL